MNPRYSIWLFRAAIVVGGLYLVLSLYGSSVQKLPLIGGGILLLWALWLFSGLCRDVSFIRDFLLGFEEEKPALAAWDRPLPKEAPTPDRIHALVADLEPPNIGDRVFKADETKTCSSCGHLLKTEKACNLDGISLSRITLTAVGCQYWSPGLHLAGARDSEDSSSTEDSENDEDPS